MGVFFGAFLDSATLGGLEPLRKRAFGAFDDLGALEALGGLEPLRKRAFGAFDDLGALEALSVLGTFSPLAFRRPSYHSFVSRDSSAAQITHREMNRVKWKRWESIILKSMNV